MAEKIVIERTKENGWPWKGVIGGRTVYGITPTDILESLYYRYLLDIEKFCRIHVDTVEDSISVHALEDREFNRKIAELVVHGDIPIKRLCDVIKLAFEHYDTVWLVDNEDAVKLT